MPDEQATDRVRPVDLSDQAALEAFVSGTDLALVQFYTNGCGLCHSMEPVLSGVARRTGVPVGLINPRDDPPLIERFEVTSVPLLVLFRDGEPIDRREEGFVPVDELTAWLDDHGI